MSAPVSSGASRTGTENPTLRARIAVASSGLGHVARGVEAWAADLGRALYTRGFDVTLCKGGGESTAPYERVIRCAQRGSALTKRLAGLLPRCIAWRLGLGSAYGVEQMTFAITLIRLLRAERIDLLHVQDPLVALIVQRAQRIGLVTTRTILAHGTEESNQCLRRVTWLQHLAPWHEEECRRAGVSKDSWASIPNFIDTSRFTPGRFDALRAELGIPGDALVILTAAAIKRTHKRVDVLIEEFARLRAERPSIPAWLVIAGGREPDTDELVAKGRALLGDRVRFLVRFPRDRMADLYRIADVFVLNSLKEMMPIALLEAGATGLPSVVHRHPVLQWMMGPGGLAADLETPGVLASTLGQLLTNAQQRQQLGRLARDHCLASFSEEAVVDQIVAYYARVLSGEPRRPVVELKSMRPTVPAGGTPVPPDTVSVVIPTYNSAAWVTQAVESVLSQTVPATEIIVVDDGSTDSTREVLAPFNDRIRYVHQPNSGVAHARNHGIRLASGSLIAFLDADDVWHPRKLEVQLGTLANHPELALLGTDTYDWPVRSTPDVSQDSVHPAPLTWEHLAVRNRLTTSSVLVRAAVLRKAGTFDPSLHGPEDYDLWLRIAERAPIATIELPLVGYRTVQGSLGRRVHTMEAGLSRILSKLDERGVWRGRWLLRRKAHSYCRYSCAYQHLEAGNPHEALRQLLSSFARYPIPYLRSEVRMPFARARLLSKILRRVPLAPAGVSRRLAPEVP